VKPVNIEDEDVLDLGLGRSIYSKAQVEEFLKFQDSQGTRRAYLTETVEVAYGGRGKDGSWGLGLGQRVRETLIDAVGWSLVPLYRMTGPVAIFIMLGLLLWSVVKIFVSVIVRACTIYRTRGMGLWPLGALWSLPFQLIISPDRCQRSCIGCGRQGGNGDGATGSYGRREMEDVGLSFDLAARDEWRPWPPPVLCTPAGY
jgi:hypothetical protein